jgi:hypothetical protein
MTAEHVRRSFITYHLVLGLALLYLSLATLMHASHDWGSHGHLAVVGGIEAVGALLFVLPKTWRVGAILLLAIIGVALIAHTIRGEVRADLATYLAGTWYVYAHGAWPPATTG